LCEEYKRGSHEPPQVLHTRREYSRKENRGHKKERPGACDTPSLPLTGCVGGVSVSQGSPTHRELVRTSSENVTHPQYAVRELRVQGNKKQRPGVDRAPGRSLCHSQDNEKNHVNPYGHSVDMTVGKVRAWRLPFLALSQSLPPYCRGSQIENCAFLCREYTNKGRKAKSPAYRRTPGQRRAPPSGALTAELPKNYASKARI